MRFLYTADGDRCLVFEFDIGERTVQIGNIGILASYGILVYGKVHDERDRSGRKCSQWQWTPLWVKGIRHPDRVAFRSLKPHYSPYLGAYDPITRRSAPQ